MQLSIKTTVGDILVELDTVNAPLSCSQVVALADAGYYEGTAFHRVISGFMIQGGGLTVEDNGSLKDKPCGLASIQNEAGAGVSNLKYTVALARTSAPHSATSQFFINVADNKFLDFKSESPSGWGYAVFGAVVAGFDVVNAIAGVPTTRRGYHDDVPVEPIRILSVTAIKS